MNGYATMMSLPAHVAAVLFLSLSLAGMAAAREDTVGITLKDAIRMAAEKNLDVKAELYNPALAEAAIRKNRGIYDPLFSSDTTQIHYGEDRGVNLGSGYIGASKSFYLNAGINQLIPWGGNVGLGFTNGWTKTESGNASESYRNTLEVTISQPLLKNFGRESTELNISVAQFGKDASLEQFRTKLTDIVTQVRTEYFKLYNFREDLEVKKSSLALAEKVLNETRARVKAGVLPAMEILSAEATVSTRERDVINAERNLRDESDLLRTLLQLEGTVLISPSDEPIASAVQIDDAEALKRAQETRSELRQLRESLKSAELQERVARHQVMPDLTLYAGAGLSGSNRDYGKQWEGLLKGDYPVWNVGMTFSYPLGNTSAKNDYITAKLKAEQLRTQIRSKEEGIANEVRSAIRALHAGYKQLDVTKRGSAYAAEVLNAYIKKAAVGLATTKDVFDVQDKLVTAKGAEISARTGYDNALTQYWKTTGELLDREGIRITGKQADTLYGKMK